MLNPITAALADVAVGLETSFNRLSVVPLLARVPPASPHYITLDEALARGDFEVTEVSETGQVPELHVVNTGKDPVLLLDGEELIGAKQTRDDAWEPWVLYMLDAVHDTAVWTTTIKAIRELLRVAEDHKVPEYRV